MAVRVQGHIELATRHSSGPFRPPGRHFDAAPPKTDRELLDVQASVLARAGREVDRLERHLAEGRTLVLEAVAVFGELEGLNQSDLLLSTRLHSWAQAKPGEAHEDQDDEEQAA